MNLKDRLIKTVLLKDVLQEVKGPVKVYVESEAKDYDVYNYNVKGFYKEVSTITDDLKELKVVDINADDTKIYVAKKRTPKPTWKQAMKIMKALQEEYQLPIFAATFKGSCSCCAEPYNFNKEAYLTPDVKKKSWSEIDAYVVFKNSENAAGEADLKADFGVVDDDGYVVETDQYVGYHTSETFTLEKFNELMTRFVEQLNELTLVKYDIKLPEDKYSCAIISKSVS